MLLKNVQKCPWDYKPHVKETNLFCACSSGPSAFRPEEGHDPDSREKLLISGGGLRHRKEAMDVNPSGRI